jgi:hypothetical protein
MALSVGSKQQGSTCLLDSGRNGISGLPQMNYKILSFMLLLSKGVYLQFKSTLSQLCNIADNQIDCGVAD